MTNSSSDLAVNFSEVGLTNLDLTLPGIFFFFFFLAEMCTMNGKEKSRIAAYMAMAQEKPEGGP